MPVACILLVAVGLVYFPAVGHGFVKDDFGWIGRSRIGSVSDFVRLMDTAPTGFFRPIISLSFGINRWVCGFVPLCYGLTNVVLAIGCAGAIFLLGRALLLPDGAAILASALWIFNWHGVNMAVLWISGRTALVVVLFATLATCAFVKQRVWSAVLLTLAAMLSKEEAVLLPLILITWFVAERSTQGPLLLSRLFQFAIGSVAAEALYFVLRAHSGAFTPTTAPQFYQLSFTASRLASNAPAYLDRSAAFSAFVMLLWLAICRPRRTTLRPSSWRVIRFGVLWWCGTLAVTVFLPVRSSLYACLPSVGIALSAAAVVSGTWPSISRHRQRRAIAAGLVLPFLLWPVYYTRNLPSVREAELSTQTINALDRIAVERGGGTVVLLRDDRSHKPSLDNSFGTLFQEAADLMVTPHVRVWIDPPPIDAALAGLIQPSHVDLELMLREGALMRVP